MSSFTRRARNPVTGEFELAWWIDDYFGRHRYGIRFPSTGVPYREADFVEWKFEDPDPEPLLAASRPRATVSV